MCLINLIIYSRDQVDEKNVHLFDTSTGKPLNDGKPFTHRQEVRVKGTVSRERQERYG
jgi:intraflagellar transport protein 80